jgi:type VI secretion system secreted protein Hcp
MAVDMFLKLDGIKGESQDVKHKDEIDLLSWSWGINNPARGPARVSDVVVVKHIDVASPSLFDAVCSGDALAQGQIVVRKAGDKGEDFIKITMEEVFISSVTPASGAGDALPMEQATLSFQKVVFEYRRQRDDGSLEGWVTSSCTPKSRRGGGFPQ